MDWFESWPPAFHPGAKLFIRETLTHEVMNKLTSSGWDVVDVRTMENSSDADRAEGLKAYLEGVRVGSIATDPKKQKALELEATIYGLKTTKQASDKKSSSLEKLNIQDVLSFKSSRAGVGTWRTLDKKDDTSSVGVVESIPDGVKDNEQSGRSPRSKAKSKVRPPRPNAPGSDVPDQDAPEIHSSDDDLL